MKRVLTAVILIPIVVLALFKAPLWLFTLLVLGVALLAAREYFDIAEKHRIPADAGLGLFFRDGHLYRAVWSCIHAKNPVPSVLLVWWLHSNLNPRVTIFLLFSPLVFLAMALRREVLSHALRDAAASFLVIPYIALTLLLLVMLRGFRVRLDFHPVPDALGLVR